MNSNINELSPKLRTVSHLLSYIRSDETQTEEFRFYANRLMNILCEEALALKGCVYLCKTPTNSTYQGLRLNQNQMNDIVAISIMRAGDSMLTSFLSICPQATVGKILIQRDEHTALPQLMYTKLPPISKSTLIFLLDPMLGMLTFDDCLFLFLHK